MRRGHGERGLLEAAPLLQWLLNGRRTTAASVGQLTGPVVLRAVRY